MAIISHNDLRINLKILIDGEPYAIVESNFVKPGKGTAFTRFRAKSLFTGRIIERTVKANEKIETADIKVSKMEYLYNDGHSWHFMDSKSCEQIEVNADGVGDAAPWLKENDECEVLFFNGSPISVTPPNFIIVAVTECEPAVRGDTVSNVTKKATVATGGIVDVPMFIDIGDTLKVDTRTRSYVERAGK
jgi:elongation factor P